MSIIPDRAAIGSLAQLAGVDDFVLGSGLAAGLRVWRVRTGGRLGLDILPDRALDVGRVDIGGIQPAWWSPLGFAEGGSRTPGPMEWLDHFSGGLLTTCGLQAVGSPSRHDDLDWPLHGSISHRAAEQARWWLEAEPEPELVCAGVVREASALGPNLVLARELRLPLGGSSIRLSDTVCNEGFEPTAIQLLYHINLGWPFTTDEVEWSFPPGSTAYPLDDSESSASDEAFRRVPEGTSRLFRQRVPALERSITVRARAPIPHVGEGGAEIAISYDSRQLPALWSWFDRRPGRNVIGVEPSLGTIEGRAQGAEEGLIQTLPPGGEQSFGLTIDLNLTAAA
jgi:hypothetical protein